MIFARKHTAGHENVGERQALALPLELEEGAPPAIQRRTMLVISTVILALLVWSQFARVREVSFAAGAISPAGLSREVAHLEGGIIEDVLVTPGAAVQAGDPLIRLRRVSDGGDTARLSARKADLTLRAQRLAAQADESVPDFTEFADTYPTLVAQQLSHFRSATATHAAEMAGLISSVTAAEAELAKAKAELAAKRDLLTFAQEQLAIQDQLIGEGYTSQQSYLSAKGAVASASADRSAALARFEQAEKSLEAAEAAVQGAESGYQSAIAEERAQVLASLEELEEPLNALMDRTDRLVIRSPIDGVVNELNARGAGDVIAPGAVVATVTPRDAPVFAEVRVAPKDIGHIVEGLPTDVSVTTFDPNRFGKLTGKVALVSPDAQMDERTGEPFFLAHIALDQQTIGKGHNERGLSPGMQVQAEIVTQSRSFFAYALKPVTRSLDQAFTER